VRYTPSCETITSTVKRRIAVSPQEKEEEFGGRIGREGEGGERGRSRGRGERRGEEEGGRRGRGRGGQKRRERVRERRKGEIKMKRVHRI
jgi:hypothetical protein